MITRLKQKLDYDDYAGIPADRDRYEIIDGDLYVTPAPSPFHQRMSKRLQRKLEAHFEGPGSVRSSMHPSISSSPITTSSSPTSWS